MSITTIYRCDICKEEKDVNDLYKIQIESILLSQIQSYAYRHTEAINEICSPCGRKIGLTLNRWEKTPKPTPEPTIEDMLKNLVISVLQEERSDQ